MSCGICTDEINLSENQVEEQNVVGYDKPVSLIPLVSLSYSADDRETGFSSEKGSDMDNPNNGSKKRKAKTAVGAIFPKLIENKQKRTEHQLSAAQRDQLLLKESHIMSQSLQMTSQVLCSKVIILLEPNITQILVVLKIQLLSTGSEQINLR